MKLILHPLCAIALALVLALTSQAMAVVRGASVAAGETELCIGGQIVSVYTDAEGNPTQAPHVCPDCIITFALGGAPSQVSAHPFGIGKVDHGPYRRETVIARRATAFAARAPPV